MATVSEVPVDTSLRILVVASTNTWLPEAPPTESSASTRGTPAANMVDSVRVQRAMVAFSITGPKIGRRSINLSMVICSLRERLHAWKNAYKPPPIAPKIAHHHCTKKSEMVITSSVGAGRSAPKLVNISLKAGITKIMMIAVITKATTTIEMG